MSGSALDASLRFPGGTIRLRSPDTRIAERVRERLGAHLRPYDPGTGCTGEVTFVPGELPDAGWEAELRGRLEGDRLIAELSGARGSYDLATHAGRFEIALQVPWFELYLENALRMVLVEEAERAGRWVCHSAAVADPYPDRVSAYLFFGRSGAGKTTTTELSAARGLKPINDDLVFLHRTSDSVTVQGCPFHGQTKIRRFAEGCFPLRAAFRLEQSDRHALTRLRLAEAVRELSASMVAWRRATRAEQEARVAMAEAVCRTVPVYRLQFRKDSNFWEIIHDELRGMHVGPGLRERGLLEEGR